MISIIAAVADKLAIGRNGQLAFHISADLRMFKELTMGHPVIMGRKTFESLPSGALPGRQNIVITRNPRWSAPSVQTAASLDEAIALTEADSNPFIIGGGEIYRQALPLAGSLYITRIYAPVPDADTFFPSYEESWKIVEESERFTDPRNGIDYQFLKLEPKLGKFGF